MRGMYAPWAMRLTPVQKETLSLYRRLYARNPHVGLLSRVARRMHVSRQCVFNNLKIARDKGVTVPPLKPLVPAPETFFCRICRKTRPRSERAPHRNYTCKRCADKKLYWCACCKKGVPEKKMTRQLVYCRKCAAKRMVAYFKGIRKRGGPRLQELRKNVRDAARRYWHKKKLSLTKG